MKKIFTLLLALVTIINAYGQWTEQPISIVTDGTSMYNNEAIVGTMLRGIKIMSDSEIETYCKQNKVDAAFLCLPRNSVKPNLDKLYNLGIRNFWNFSHYDIKNDYPDVIVENVHMSDSLMTLCYEMKSRGEEKND